MPPQENTRLLSSSPNQHSSSLVNNEEDGAVEIVTGATRDNADGILDRVTLWFAFSSTDDLLHDSQQNHHRVRTSKRKRRGRRGLLCFSRRWLAFLSGSLFLIVLLSIGLHWNSNNNQQRTSDNKHTKMFTGPYRLVEAQFGDSFWDFYDFHTGADTIGSAGYNDYVSQETAQTLGLIQVVDDNDESFVLMNSSATDGPRSSIRLEGKRRFDRGLFILDLAHMPAGCGVWPAFWLTDTGAWPDHGEIDIVEGINEQSVAKTALHTRESCSMYQQVPAWARTGVWDTATGLFNRFTGVPDYDNTVDADNCWVDAPHQWPNQGCVSVSTDNTTLGKPLNEVGGGVFVLEWDPDYGYIKSWAFPGHANLPANLKNVLDTAQSSSRVQDRVLPAPETWNSSLPYAYFAIGEQSTCSSDHFQNMQVIFNLAFCGQVAGNRFAKDCPLLLPLFNVTNDAGFTDPILSCNAYIQSNPKALEEAYWKIRGLYIYEREAATA